ncbi:MAG TPA: acetate kinase [Candidatus Methylomirabilis sp.]|nr:acetate kinase [Candidatus Methylomirabilis sp.]
MNILVINSGSSSLKYQLFDMHRGFVLTAGIVERIGETNAALRHQWRTSAGALEQFERAVIAPDHRAAFLAIRAAMRETGVLRDATRVDAIGHRVVHGGERFRAPTRIDADVLSAIRALVPLAPLHNPPNVLGIELCLELFPTVPQVAVFDTAFHQTMPPHAYHYALPHRLYTDHAVRRYGFHGSSHAYVTRRATAYLAQPPGAINLISLHLGNGASAAAVEGGRCIDTSMGMTPLEGLVMGTRCGDIDPALVFYIGRAAGLNEAAVEALLNKDSGLKGLCGANDMREVLRRMEAGDAQARLAFEIYCYRIRKYIGAYTAALGRVDAVIFTAGIGENAAAVRARVCAGLDTLGVRLDAQKNASVSGEIAEIQSANSAVRLLVVRTNEEREIAEQVRAVLGTAGG